MSQESDSTEIASAEVYKRSLDRERRARKEAEKLLEERSRELYASNQKLVASASKLEKEVQRTKAVFANAAEGIVIFNARGEIEALNQAGAEIFGFEEEQYFGTNICELIPVAYALLLSDNKQKLSFDDLTGENNEVMGNRVDGSHLPLEFVISQFTHQGEVTFSGIVRDLTRRKVLEQQLAHAQKMESVGQLAAGVAHELNTPIQFVSDNTSFLKSSFEEVGSILDLVENLVRKCGEQGLLVEDAKRIEEACTRVDLEFLRAEVPIAAEQTLQGTNTLARIVKAMKVFSHPGTKNYEEVDLNHALESTLTVSKSEWRYHCNLETQFANDLPKVTCLPGELNQVFLNLIVNAAHAMVGDGSGKSKGELTVRTFKTDHHVVVEIQDTGGGVPKSIQHRIFDPFFTTKEAGKGTGQGLSICYSIVVELHRGELSFESTEGVGTTFRVALPIEFSERR